MYHGFDGFIGTDEGLGPSMPHGRAKVEVEGWVSRMRRRIRERTRMRGRARVAVGDGRGSSSRKVQVSAWSCVGPGVHAYRS